MHSQLKKEVIADYSLVYIWQGNNSAFSTVLFDSHYDVVPIEPGAEDDWEYAP